MIIFHDVITNDELISDSYDLKEVGNGVAYEANCSKITVGGETFDTGANASAEEADEGTSDEKQTVLDVEQSFRLTKSEFGKKDYLTHLKGYMKAVAEKLKENGEPDETIETFKKEAQTFAKQIVANFNDYEFYIGESMNPDGMVVLLNYREDGMTPFVTLWKHGLKQVKV